MRHFLLLNVILVFIKLKKKQKKNIKKDSHLAVEHKY